MLKKLTSWHGTHKRWDGRARVRLLETMVQHGQTLLTFEEDLVEEMSTI